MIVAGVPDQIHGGIRFQDPLALCPELFRIKPVKRLCRNNKIHAPVFEQRVFRRSDMGDESGISRKIPFRNSAHIIVRFHSDDTWMPIQQLFQQNSGTGADFGYDGFPVQFHRFEQVVNVGLRISWTVFRICFSFSGEFINIVHLEPPAFCRMFDLRGIFLSI